MSKNLINFLPSGKLIKSNLKVLLIAFPLVGFSQLLISDFTHLQLLPIEIIFFAASMYWIFKPTHTIFDQPKNQKGWINLCNEDLEYFKETFENIIFDKNFLEIFNFRKIREFIIEIS